mmetsp:Transcript_10636/g.17442  ORF Transcript_10636/g.17442 Transcript_10636/m.17442 type:complete len:302 (-) Transcript_10636:117-1022(-)
MTEISPENVAFQAVVGDWSYLRNGKEFTYTIQCQNGRCTFKQRDTGAEGVLSRVGDGFEGDVKLGIIRLTLRDNGTLFSEFRLKSDDQWIDPTIASRIELKEEAGYLQRMSQYAAMSVSISSIADILQVPPFVVLAFGVFFALCFLLYGFCGQLVCNVIGFGYPALESFKCLQHHQRNPRHTEFWLQYWTVFAVIALLENCTYYIVVWIPFYYPAKLCLVLWLCSPLTQGAQCAFELVVSPLFSRHQYHIDNAIRVSAQDVKNTLRNPAVLGSALNAGIIAEEDIIDHRPSKKPRIQEKML